jgi:dihydroneopterin aldolase
MTSDSITLTGLRITAHHGVFDFERENGQEFVVDVTVWLDFRAAAAADDLARTIHYGELATEVAAAVRRDPVDLLETLAERIADVALAHEAAQRVRVTVHKPQAPIEVPFADVSVQIERVQSDRAQSDRGGTNTVQTEGSRA